jgi:hypothetical protein
MKKRFTIFTTTLLLTALIVSCGKETQSSTQGGGMFKVRVTITPPLNNGGAIGNSNTFAVLLPENYQWNGYLQSSSLSSWQSQEISVTKGQNVQTNLAINTYFDLKCRQVKFEGILNGNVIKTIDLELGQTSISPPVNCKDQVTGTYLSINSIIP